MTLYIKHTLSEEQIKLIITIFHEKLRSRTLPPVKQLELLRETRHWIELRKEFNK